MSFFNSLGRSLRSPKPKKPPNGAPHLGSPQKSSAGHHHHAQSTEKPLFLCQPFVRTALVKGSFKTIVVQPKYVDEMEWLALNAFEFYTHLHSLTMPILDTCNCSTMSSSPGHEYTWLDSATRQPTHLPAAQYIDYVLTWINNRLNDESLFPTREGRPIGENARPVIRAVIKQMARVFVHIYWHHFNDIINFSLEAHWNSFFGHFLAFIKEFSLYERRDLEPLQELVDAFEQQGKT